MKLSFKQKNKKESPSKNTFIALDIGTEVLKALLFRIRPTHVEILKSARISQQELAMDAGAIRDLDMVLSNCRLALTNILHDIPDEQQPAEIVLGLAGEFVQGVAITVNYLRDKDPSKQVDEKEQEDLLNKVHKQIINTGKESLSERTGLLPEDIEILHITTMGMEIGGLRANSLIGYTGKQIKAYFYASFAPKTYVNALKKLATDLNLGIIGIVAQPFAVAQAFNQKDVNSAIFVDIGGGTTDVAIVEDGKVIDTEMFAFGGRVFTRQISKEMNIDFRHAELRKLKYSENSLDRKLASPVKRIMNKTAQLWLETFTTALENVEDVSALPPRIFLCGGGSLLPEIRTSLLEYPWTRLLKFARDPQISLFTPAQLADVKDLTGELNNAYDVTPVALTKFAYDKMTKPNNYYIKL